MAVCIIFLDDYFIDFSYLVLKYDISWHCEPLFFEKFSNITFLTIYSAGRRWSKLLKDNVITSLRHRQSHQIIMIIKNGTSLLIPCSALKLLPLTFSDDCFRTDVSNRSAFHSYGRQLNYSSTCDNTCYFCLVWSPNFTISFLL